VNYHTRDWVHSTGQWVENVPAWIDGVFRLPVFARGGSLLPMMPVDARTKDTFGHRSDGSVATDLVVQVVPDATRSTFTLYEDDGTTVTFAPDGTPSYATRTTELTQQLAGTRATVTIGAAAGTYDGAPASRNTIVRLVVEDARATGVTLNGGPLPERASEDALAASDSGWVNAGRNLVLMKSGTLPVAAAKAFAAQLTPVTPTVTANFVCDNAWTALGEQVVVTGGHPSLGNWDPAKGIALSPSIYWAYVYDPPPGHNGPGPSTPKWTGVARGLPASQTIEWKCVRRLNSGEFQFEAGANRQVTTPARGFAGTARGSF
jgi:alpha-glucosidase